VHGQLSRYRLGRLISTPSTRTLVSPLSSLLLPVLLHGFSGQTLVDDISAAVYNVVFTSLPILPLLQLDKPLKFETMVQYPQTYNWSNGLDAHLLETAPPRAFRNPADTPCACEHLSLWFVLGCAFCL
jgi:hypothetical protein